MGKTKSWPCAGVLYGQNAARVHGGNGTSHCIKYYIYNFICACGLVAGPTRRAMRAAYNLPAEPACFGNGNMADCLTHTTPCVNCCALSQEAREIAARNPLAPIDAIPFSWGPIKSPSESPTKAPSQAEMTTEIPK